MQKIKSILLVLAVTLLLFTRFTNIGWGLPYPMHPDERNMAVAIQGLACHITWPISIIQLKECLNPHFFAYGQAPLYLAYAGIGLMHLIFPTGDPILFDEAVMALRLISAIASVLTAAVFMNILFLYIPKKRFIFHFTSFLIVIFSPYFIQFSHFGTTESCLMLCYVFLLFLSLKILHTKKASKKEVCTLGIVAGSASAIKISSLIFWFLPAAVLAWIIFSDKKTFKSKLTHTVSALSLLIGSAGLTTILLSPHNLLSLYDFLGALSYESAVATGTYIPFYTKQFVGTIPILYQLTHIFPYVLGWPVFILFLAGMAILPWNARTNILRLAFLLYFVPTSFTLAKWTRFMAPVLPVATLIAILATHRAYQSLIKRVPQIIAPVFVIVSICALLPGIAFLSVYTQQDVRFRASEWIFSHIQEGEIILSETANVIDIPIPFSSMKNRTRHYQYTSFNFYEVDQNPALQDILAKKIQEAKYIFIPSRRVFANLTCVKTNGPKLISPLPCGRETIYPVLNTYYQRLIDGSFGFTIQHIETAYPHISLFGKTLLSFPDENAEETWTVFDHPVIRIYGRTLKGGIQVKGDVPLDFSTYPLVEMDIRGKMMKLLVADSPQKWSQGLMYVRSLKGADGMLFIFPETAPLSFWNKNTVSDLDLYWMRDNTIVGTTHMKSIEKTKNVVSFTSPGPVNRVVEILK